MTTQDEPTLLEHVEQPDGVPERLAAQIRFIVEVDKLKTVLRRSPLVADDRRENDAEHSWHLALMVPILAEYADDPINVGHTVELVLLHDRAAPGGRPASPRPTCCVASLSSATPQRS